MGSHGLDSNQLASRHVGGRINRLKKYIQKINANVELSSSMSINANGELVGFVSEPEMAMVA